MSEYYVEWFKFLPILIFIVWLLVLPRGLHITGRLWARPSAFFYETVLILILSSSVGLMFAFAGRSSAVLGRIRRGNDIKDLLGTSSAGIGLDTEAAFTLAVLVFGGCIFVMMIRMLVHRPGNWSGYIRARYSTVTTVFSFSLAFIAILLFYRSAVQYPVGLLMLTFIVGLTWFSVFHRTDTPRS